MATDLFGILDASVRFFARSCYQNQALLAKLSDAKCFQFQCNVHFISSFLLTLNLHHRTTR